MIAEKVLKPVTIRSMQIERYLRQQADAITVVSSEPIKYDFFEPHYGDVALRRRIIIAPKVCTYDLTRLTGLLEDISGAGFKPDKLVAPDFNRFTQKFTAGKLVFRENLGIVSIHSWALTTITMTDPLLVAWSTNVLPGQGEVLLFKNHEPEPKTVTLNGETVVYLYYDLKVARAAARLFPYTPDKVPLSAKRLKDILRQGQK